MRCGVYPAYPAFFIFLAFVQSPAYQFAEKEQAATDQVGKFGANLREPLCGRLDLIRNEPLRIGVVEQGVRAITLGVSERGDEKGGHPDVVDIDGGGHSYTSCKSNVCENQAIRAGLMRPVSLR